VARVADADLGLLTSSDLGPSSLAATTSTIVMVQAVVVVVALAVARVHGRTIPAAWVGRSLRVGVPCEDGRPRRERPSSGARPVLA